MQQPKLGSRPYRFESGAVVHVNVLPLLRADHLVALLIILVCCHIFLERGGQGVIGKFLEPIAQPGVAHDGREELERVHRFDHGAELGPLRRAAPGQVLIAGEDSRGLAVILVQQVEHREDRRLVAGFTGQQVAHPAILEGHARVHTVGVEIELALGFAGELEVAELGLPVMALGERLAGKVQEPVLAGPGVQPVEADGEIGNAQLRPAIKRRLIDDLIDLASTPQ